MNEKFRSVLALCDISQTIVVSIFYLVNDSHIKIGPSGHFSFIIIDYCSLIEFVRIKKPILKNTLIIIWWIILKRSVLFEKCMFKRSRMASIVFAQGF